MCPLICFHRNSFFSKLLRLGSQLSSCGSQCLKYIALFCFSCDGLGQPKVIPVCLCRLLALELAIDSWSSNLQTKDLCKYNIAPLVFLFSLRIFALIRREDESVVSDLGAHNVPGLLDLNRFWDIRGIRETAFVFINTGNFSQVKNRCGLREKCSLP